MKVVTLALTGASGAQYGLCLLEQLVKQNINVYLLLSNAAKEVLRLECDIELPEGNDQIASFLSQLVKNEKPELIQVFSRVEWTSPVASGSNAPEAMIVCPCSSGTLSAVANGASNNLIERAADVMIKEKRQLIMVHREMPISPIHIDNMQKLASLGVTIMPASPGFYHKPQSVQSMIEFVVARVLDHLRISHDLVKRWGEDN